MSLKAVKIHVDVPQLYLHTEEDREFLKVGQKLTGYVQLDGPGRPKSIEIRWVDSHNRVLGRSAGKLDAYQRRVHFEFQVNQSPFWVHFIECDIDGKTQSERAQFAISPVREGWWSAPAITWANYPSGDFYDRLQEVGVNGHIAYRTAPFDHVARSGMRFYVDQMAYFNISLYHRPFKTYWETAPLPTGSVGHFSDHWKTLIEQYKRLRAQAKKEGVQISRNAHARKLLWRRHCPNDPGTWTITAERVQAVVRQHKGYRPLFFNIADEAGITDQTRPFDFCYCDWCMDQFRLKLQKRYGTLTELNAQWGTDFATWGEVFPLTCDETMAAQGKGRPWNFASWADHREFMDDTFADHFRRMRLVGKDVDPITDFSQGGCQWPTIYGGWDYAKVTRDIDALIPYNLGGNQEIIRSVRPNVKNLSPFFGDDARHVRGLWSAYIHGDAGVIFWDNDEKKGRFVTRPSGKLAHRGKVFGPALREMRGGYAQQFQTWSREDDPIGLLYSQPNERAHWMLETLVDDVEWFDRVYRSRYVRTRFGWQNLIEDRQLQYRYVSYLDIDEGNIDLSRFRMLVLPETIALSDTLVRALRDYVVNGGVLVADGRVGRMTANCRQTAAGLLDDLFGVTSPKELNLKCGAKLKAVSASEEPWLAFDSNISHLNAADAGLRLARSGNAEAAAVAGQAPAIIRRQVGSGWAVLLNIEVGSYVADRYLADSPRGQLLRELLDVLCELAGVELALDVTSDDAVGTMGVEVTRFSQRGCTMVAALLNRQFRVSGIGETLQEKDLEAFESDRKLTLHFPDVAFTWNSRTGEYLGHVDQVTQKLPCLTPLIVSRLPYRVRGIDLTLPGKPTPGGRTADVVVRIKADGELADHVVRVDVYQPDGTWCYWYSDSVVAAGGEARLAIPLAFNDPAGRWKVTVRDTVTGATRSGTLRVGKA
ncbi:MAG: hypothetical protein BIFFINMI_02265 [Phycisphaerae bacterium]|nr:hypothetical protein [Phycisphaerae bacterium]